MKSMTIRDEMCRIDGDDDDNNNYDDDAINRFILNKVPSFAAKIMGYYVDIKMLE